MEFDFKNFLSGESQQKLTMNYLEPAIGLENFRIFSEHVLFKLSPITILTGANNSGKSSVIKALLLLDENNKKNNLFELDFSSTDSDKHKLGSFDNALNKYSKKNIIKFNLKYFDTYTGGINFLFEYKKYKNRILLNRLDLYSYSGTIPFFSLIFQDLEEKQNKISYNFEYDFNYFIEYDEIICSVTGEDMKSSNIPKSFIKKNILKEKLQNFHKKEIEEFINFIEKDLMNKFQKGETWNFPINKINEATFTPDYILLMIKYKSVEKLYKNNKKINNNCLLACSGLLIQDILNIEYLDFFRKYIIPVTKGFLKNLFDLSINFQQAVKANSQRIYLNHNQGTSFNELILTYIKNYSNKKKEAEFINFWLGKKGFNIADKIKFIPTGYGTIIKLIKNKKEFDLADMGYGTTQLLSILLKIVISQTSERTILMLEEPEINLHPNFQSKLADLFVDANNKFNIIFIIETHSEYLIRKLQYLTAKKIIGTFDTQIYYFYHPDNIPEGEEQVKEINIKKNGVVSDNFGKGFFDEADNLSMDLFMISDLKNN